MKVLVNRLGDLSSTYLLRQDNLRLVYDALVRLSSGEDGCLAGARADEDPQKCILNILKGAIQKSIVLCGDGSREGLAGKLIKELKGPSDHPLSKMTTFLELCMAPALYNGIERMWRKWNTVPVRESLLGLASGTGSVEELGVLDKVRAIRHVYQEDLEKVLPNSQLADKGGTGRADPIKKLASFIDRNAYHFYKRCALSLVKSLWQDACQKDPSGSQSFLKMSDLSRFFSFVRQPGMLVEDCAEPEGLCALHECLAEMLLLFKYVMDLLDEAHVSIVASARPTVYEGICNCIRDLVGADGCLMAYFGDGEPRIILGSSLNGDVLSPESGYRDDYGWGRQFEAERETLAKLRSDADSSEVEEYAIVIRPSGSACRDGLDGCVCFVPLYFAKTQEFGSERRQRFPKINVCEKRKVLYLRSRLVKALDRDLVQLLADDRDYSSVGRISPSGSRCRALHLSDLHIDASRPSFVNSLIEWLNDMAPVRAKRIESGLDELFPGAYDLVIISGDVAQASNSGSGQKENYQLAGSFIRALARYLWTDLDGNVRWDWFKRVAVVTGNHDYTSSSGFEAMNVNRRRASEIAKPTKRATEVPAKFVYFYDFLHNVLRADLGHLWQNHLNEVRNYDALRASVIMLNSSALAGPLRTNKVGISSRVKPKALAKQVVASNQVIIVVHHAPDYEIDYVEDEFCTAEFLDAAWSSADLHKLEEDVSSLAKMTEPDGNEHPIPFPNGISDLGDAFIQSDMSRRHGSGVETNIARTLKEEAEEIKERCKREREQSSLADTLKRAVSCLETGDAPDEYVSQISSVIDRFKSASESDKEKYSTFFSQLGEQLNEHGRITGTQLLYLCGHTHIGSESLRGGSIQGSELQEQIKVLGRFHDRLWCVKNPSSNPDPFDGFFGSAVRSEVDGVLNRPLDIKRFDVVRYGELVNGKKGSDYWFKGAFLKMGTIQSNENPVAAHCEIRIIPKNELKKCGPDILRWQYGREIWCFAEGRSTGELSSDPQRWGDQESENGCPH